MGILRWFADLFQTDESTTNALDEETRGIRSSTQAVDSKESDFTKTNDFLINPASGLPMVGGLGGFDIAGNPFGMDLYATNPANGLPMVGGIAGGLDVEGNPYGTDSSHDRFGSLNSDDS